MREKHRKVLAAAALCGCGLSILYGMAHVAATAEAVPSEANRKPVIILDAGHGESN